MLSLQEASVLSFLRGGGGGELDIHGGENTPGA